GFSVGKHMGYLHRISGSSYIWRCCLVRALERPASFTCSAIAVLNDSCFSDSGIYKRFSRFIHGRLLFVSGLFYKLVRGFKKCIKAITKRTNTPPQAAAGRSQARAFVRGVITQRSEPSKLVL